MKLTYILVGLLFSAVGIIIMYKNAGNIKKDLDDDTTGVSLKYYGMVGLLIVFGVYMLFFAK